jgi:flagellar protein FlaJ
MPKIEPKEKRLVAIVSVALGVTMLVATIATLILFLGVTLPLQWDRLLIVGLMIALFPPATVEYLDLRWQRGIDKNIPSLLREIAESGRTGLTLTRAIEVSSERDYGPLTPELKRLLAQLSWGATLEDALHAFAIRARTKLAQRVATLITEVSRSGGDTQEIMEQVNHHINELQTIDRERYTQMRPYSVVVYIAFGVFLFTDIMLIQTFFTQIINMQSKVLQSAGGGGVFGGIGSVNISLLKEILFHATIIQAIFGGLIAGKMSEGKLGAGLKHTVMLLLITFMAFFLFVWGV